MGTPHTNGVSWRPTRKWAVARVAALTGFLIALIENGWELTTSLQIMGVTLLGEAVSSYLTSNQPPLGEGDGERGQATWLVFVVGLLAGMALLYLLARA